MAKKRMFSLDVVDSDAFLDMPQTAQNLYFHLGMRADDDGFIGNYKRIVGYIGAKSSDMKELIEKRFVLIIGNVVVIKHWRINNNIYKDRYNPTTYQDEFKTLTIKDNKSYTDRKRNDYENGYTDDYNNVTANGNTDVNNVSNGYSDIDTDTDLDTDIDIDKESLVQSKDVHDTDSDLEQFYESIWTLYPIKKGRGQVSKTKKKVLQRIGYDELKRCVERFIRDMESEGRDKKYWMQGSTFFNSGYVDYLDKNYDSIESKTKEQDNTEEPDRFACLDPAYRSQLEEKGLIKGQALSYGDLTDKDFELLRESGVDL